MIPTQKGEPHMAPKKKQAKKKKDQETTSVRQPVFLKVMGERLSKEMSKDLGK